MTNLAHLPAHNPTLMRQKVRAAHCRPLHHQMMFLMKSAVGFNRKLLPWLFWEPELSVQSACHQAIVELPDRPRPIAGVRNDIEARRDTYHSVKMNTQPHPTGSIYS